MKQCPASTLSLQGLRVSVRLGHGFDEQETPQPVLFDVQLRFVSPPEACWTDQLNDTVCYAQISETLQKVCDQKAFHLIEHLGWEAYQRLKNKLRPEVRLSLKVTKVRPPIPSLENGASFCLED